MSFGTSVFANDLKKEIIRDKNGFNHNLTKTIFKILS